MAKVFISYRRADSQHAVDRLYAGLSRQMAEPKRDIFMDVDNIPLGVDFEDHLSSKVAECETLLCVIGPNWLSEIQARAEDPKDFVRIEIEAALKRGIPVVPILLDGAPVPAEHQLPPSIRALSRRNGTEIRRATFEANVETLARGLGLKESAQVQKSGVSAPSKRSSSRGMIAAVSILALISGGAGVWFGDLFGIQRLLASNSTTADRASEGAGVTKEEPAMTLEDALANPDDPPGSAPDFSALVEERIVGKGLDDAASERESPADAAARGALVERLQRALIDLGHLQGPVDGIAGSGTVGGATRFAREAELDVPAIQYGSLVDLEAFVIRAETALADLKEIEQRDAERRKQLEERGIIAPQ
ncbi:MAG: TIR domain-containing protein [Pseudomonadota bacterium]